MATERRIRSTGRKSPPKDVAANKPVRPALPKKSFNRMTEQPNHEQVTLHKVHSALAGLSVLEFEVLTALFPDNGIPEPYEVIANKFGLTTEEVKDIEANALRDLRGTRQGMKRIGAPWN